ncbi:MAG: VOC family protein [Desulfosarcina sp.]
MVYQLNQLGVEDLDLIGSALDCFGEAFDEPENYGSNRPEAKYMRGLLASDTIIAVVAQKDQKVIGGLVAYELRKLEESTMIEPKSSFPVFIVKDLSAAKSFYTAHFGFDVAYSNEWYLHLVSESGVQVGFMLPEQPSQPPIFQKPYDGEGVIFSLEVDDADAAFAAAESKSPNIVLKLRSEDWGQRHFCIKDPNGVHLDIVQSIEPTEKYQSGYDSE